jgi:hypothetical protein
LSTKLTERVGKWQARLAPLLEEEERKASFDIHQYSEVLIENALAGLKRTKRKSDGTTQDTSTLSKIVDFGSVTRGCTKSDVCRFFLASLSLANSGNLKIEEGTPDFLFEITSDKVEKPMETYRAPSVTVGSST